VLSVIASLGGILSHERHSGQPDDREPHKPAPLGGFDQQARARVPVSALEPKPTQIHREGLLARLAGGRKGHDLPLAADRRDGDALDPGSPLGESLEESVGVCESREPEDRG